MSSDGRDTPGGIFSLRRRPVEFSAEGSTQPKRATLITVAIAVLLAGLLTGLAYKRFWGGASHDPTRLIPASASAYIKGWRPIESIGKTMRLDRWKSVDPQPSYLLPTGNLHHTINETFAGVPFPVLLDATAGITEFELAAVPNVDSVGAVAFVKSEDSSQQRRVISWLSDVMELVDRRFGFDISMLSRRQGFVPWRQPVLPIRMVPMEPFLLFTFGNESSLNRILDAKVGTISTPIRATRAFRTLAIDEPLLGGVRGYISPGAIVDAIANMTDSAPQHIENWRAAISNEIMAVSFATEVADWDEVMTTKLHFLSDARHSITKLNKLLRPIDHRLLARVPLNADWAISVGLDRPIRQIGIVEGVLRRVIRDNNLSFALRPALQTLSALRVHVVKRIQRTASQAFTGEWVVASLGDDKGLLIRARLKQPELAEQLVERVVRASLGPLFNYGKVRDDDGWIHLVRPTGSDGSKDIAWRIRDRVLEFVSERKAFASMDAAATGEANYGSGDSLRDATRSLDSDSSLLFIFNPESKQWRDLHPLASLLSDTLRPGFRIGATVTPEKRTLSFRINTGLWTVAAALLMANKPKLNALTETTHSAPCLKGINALCAQAPRARVCQPFTPNRASLIRRVCTQLRL